MKILVRIVVALVLLLLLVSGLGIWFIDSLVRKAIEEAGTYALGTPTHLESADVGWTSGRFALAGLEVENPPGFADVPFFALGEGDIELAMQTVSQETIEIPHVGLSGISLSLERNSKGTNYGVLLASLERFESGGGEPSEGAGGEGSAPAGSEKRIMVKKIEIREVSVTVDLVPEAGELTKTTVTIPSLVLEDVGTAEGGLTVAQLIGRVIRDLLEATVRFGEGKLPAEFLADLQGKLDTLGAEVGTQAQEILDQAQKKLEELGVPKDGAAGDAVQKAKDEAQKALDGLLEKRKD